MTTATRTIDLEQLSTVTGGTAAETEELKQAILSNPKLAAIWDRKSSRYGFDDYRTCHMVILEAFDGVYVNCFETEPNECSVVHGHVEWYKLSHNDLLNLIKNY